jgi:hypothetical protein
MPPIKNLDLTQIMRGFPVHVYLDLTFNADGTVKNLQPDGTVLEADHPNGVELGFTQDGAELTLGQEREGLGVDQRINQVLPALTSQDPHLKVGFLQVADFETLAKLVPGAAFQTSAYATGISDQVDQTIELHSVTAIAPTASDPTKFHQLTVYACSNIAGLALKLSKSWHKMPLDFKGEDAARSDGKTWGAFIVIPVAP